MAGPNAPYTQLDAAQVIQQSFDEAGDRLRVDATFTGTIGAVTINATDSDIAIADRITGNLLKVNADGSIDANVVVSAASGDNILTVGTTDGTLSGTQKVLKLNDDGSVKTVQVFSKPFDAITGDNPDPNATTEVYRSRIGGASGVVQQTATILYRDATKKRVVSVVIT